MNNLKNSLKNDACNPKYTHPDIKLDVDIPEEWVSLSYHNDVCPSFELNGYVVFIEHQDIKRREVDTMPRFLVIHAKDKGNGGFDWGFMSDDFNEVLSLVDKTVWR